MTLVATLAFVFVIALFAMALRRGGRAWRPSDADTAGDAAGARTRRWTVWLGIAFPMSVLTALLAATLWIGEGQFVRDGSLPTWRATASQWGWQFAPIGADGTVGTTTDRLVIPAGEPVIIEIVSTDVIHSFWVPRLAGKMDAVPGKLNRHLIQADRPGTYLGVCAEYCGIGHDRMRFELIATAPRGRTGGGTR
ncbi:cytochrome C oxidase subunit II [Blastomonas sp.]|uniref:cytochrome C oxidase subunit II n=1 Tax=Blastomonas sp. TaxID=1909299 RepID=UPI00262614EC|nr:cytochrome C oxidase subunit II [Blastomonas sp.]MDM7954815.1 cytochrome C oxidase subunit II [Blastomonas sp.]